VLLRGHFKDKVYATEKYGNLRRRGYLSSS
jgi:hypothetical protein